MQMNLPTCPTQAPRRSSFCGTPGTTGSEAMSSRRRRSRPAAVRTSPTRSGMTADRSRTRPSAASTPGRSCPRGPWRNNFMGFPSSRFAVAFSGARSCSVVQDGGDLRIVDVRLVVPEEAGVDHLGQLLALEGLHGGFDGLVADAHRVLRDG